MGDLFEGYQVGPAWDEMFEAPGVARGPSSTLHDALQCLSAAELDERCAERDRSFRDQGITFSFSGEERPFPLDPVPRVISAREWASVEKGVVQRVRALEAFLQDLYGGTAAALHDGIVPQRVVATSEHFRRAAEGVEPPNGVRVHVAGIDLVRG
ncbi:MAG: circularly permuted type 2 ATP-grasp protein, partial [Acidimicrobiales bacterium]